MEERYYRVKTYRDAFYDLLDEVGSLAARSQDAAYIHGYMRHLLNEVLSFNEFCESEDKENGN